MQLPVPIRLSANETASVSRSVLHLEGIEHHLEQNSSYTRSIYPS